MKYDILTLQALQYAMEEIEKEPITNQAGICYYIRNFYGDWKKEYPENVRYEVIEQMRKTYFPNALPRDYWWPTNPYEFSKKKLADSKIKRIFFLQRIIEDLMCGE